MIRCGEAPYLECSSKGDKRFSAFSARIKSRGNRSIEELYQAYKIFPDGSTGLGWREAKGRVPTNLEDCKKFYSALWDEYFLENPELLIVLYDYSGCSDIFGQPGRVCQAEEIYRIKTKGLTHVHR